MADADEIRVYLESYPDHHEQRWRLAKTLYEQREYAPALAELLRLKVAWPDHVPVQRFLGAAHYRLGQFAEAATVLEVAVARNPGDVLLLEQLARTYEGAGRRQRAIDTWKLVLKFDASPRAVEALERLGVVAHTPPPGALASTVQELSTHGDETLVNCPHCGEPNDMFSERCWRCHGEFAVASAQAPPGDGTPSKPRGTSVAVAVVAVIVLVAVACLGLCWLW